MVPRARRRAALALLLLAGMGSACQGVNTEVGLAFNPTGEPGAAGHTNWIVSLPTRPARNDAPLRRRLAALQEEYARSVPEALVLRERASRDEVTARLAREQEVRALLTQLEPTLKDSGPLVDSVGDGLREEFERARADLALAEQRHAQASEEYLAMQDRQAEILTLAVHLETESGREGTATRLRAASMRQSAREARLSQLLLDVESGSKDLRELCTRLQADVESARAALDRGLDAYARGEVGGAEIELAVLRLVDEELRDGEAVLAQKRGEDGVIR